MVEIADRITVDPEQCGGRPCIRGMRIRVVDVLDLLANGLDVPEVLEELPDCSLTPTSHSPVGLEARSFGDPIRQSNWLSKGIAKSDIN